MKLSDETKTKILDLQKKYPKARSALIPALHLAQNEVGYLPQPIQNEVAALFNLDPNEINSVVSFYDMFHSKPVGKHIIHVCKNVSCMLRGSDELIDTICSRLNTAPHGVTADEEFTVIPSECLGACDRAPMMIVDDKVYGPVKDDELEAIFTETKSQRPHHG